MSDLPPRVRAPLTKAIVAEVDDLPADARKAVYAAVPEVIEHVGAALRTSWIPLALQIELVGTVRTVLGSDAAYQDFCARQFSKSLEIPLVKPVFQGALRLFGGGPAAVMRMFSRTWSMMTDDVGTIVIEGEIDNDGTRVRVEKLPRVADVDNLVVGFGGTFRGVIDFFGLPGSVQLESFEPSTGDAVYTMRWC